MKILQNNQELKVNKIKGENGVKGPPQHQKEQEHDTSLDHAAPLQGW